MRIGRAIAMGITTGLLYIAFCAVGGAAFGFIYHVMSCGWHLVRPEKIGWEGALGIPALVAAFVSLGGSAVFLTLSWIYDGARKSFLAAVAVWGVASGATIAVVIPTDDHVLRAQLFYATGSICLLAAVLARDHLRRRIQKKAQPTAPGYCRSARNPKP